MKLLKRIIVWTLGILILISIGGGSYLLNYSLTNQYHEGYSLNRELDSIAARNPEIATWLDSIRRNEELHDIYIKSKDIVKLHALNVNAPKKTNRVALLLHGYTDDATMMLNIGHIYNDLLGMNILIPDFRAHGLSEGGNTVGMGWKDQSDIKAWLPIITELYGDSIDIVVHGVSMGGASTMMLSGNEPDKYTKSIKCYIEDCGYTSVWDEFSTQLKEQFSLPAFPLLYIASGLNKIINGWSFKEASALDAISNTRKPMLFIHGDNDTYVPTKMVYSLYEKKDSPKELWITKNVAHAKSYSTNPEEYALRIKKFTDKYIPER